MTRAKPVDPFGAALDDAEARQRLALGDAEARVREALEALAPFKSHEGRVLPGIEAAVRDVRAALETQAANLAKVVTLHLSGHEPKAEPNPIEQRVDEAHTDRVIALKREA